MRRQTRIRSRTSAFNAMQGIPGFTRNIRDSLRTWIEIDCTAIRENVRTFRTIIGPRVKLWSVVKSNAYGHGIFTFSKEADRAGVDGFCVDVLVEGVKLRRAGLRKPILILGATLPVLLDRARAEGIAITVSNFETLKALSRMKRPPSFHVEIDTGMHRQGFLMKDVPTVVRFIRHSPRAIHRALTGVYTHFSAAKDRAYPTSTEMQFEKFRRAAAFFERAGFKDLIHHAAATGGTLLNPKYHLDAVRIGIGLYGLWPSYELEAQTPGIALRSVLSWKTLVSELKTIPKGSFVGYDITERVARKTTTAVLPVGYWHGIPRILSSIGEVLIRGRRAKILGRISMDITVVDATGIRARPGDVVTLIGSEKREYIGVDDMARVAHTSHYEIVTRLNPLIERLLV